MLFRLRETITTNTRNRKLQDECGTLITYEVLVNIVQFEIRSAL